MSRPGTTPVVVDTSAFYARVDEDDDHHEAVVALFEDIRSGDRPFRPLYTSQAVLSELATLALYKLGHGVATRTLAAVRDSSSVTVLSVDRPTFDAAAEQFTAYDDQEISFVDHTTAVLAAEREIEHCIGFDGDFRTLGLTMVPSDVEGQS